MRVVSLLPSATETVAALGRERDLVGRSAECDAPASIQDRPAVMRPKTWDAERSSSEIDARVQTTRAAGESLYELDVPLLARLRPDLILTQDLCGVCSVTDDEVATACREAGVSPRILSLSPRTLDQVADGIETVGAAMGRRVAARRLAAPLRSSGPPTRRSRPRVAVVEWLDPPILAGLWVPDMVHRSGGSSIGPKSGTVGERTSWAEIFRRRPDLVVLTPCSFSVDRTARELSGSPADDALGRHSPARGVWLADEAYFSRPGPRLADGLAVLRALLGGASADRPMALQRWDSPSARPPGVA